MKGKKIKKSKGRTAAALKAVSLPPDVSCDLPYITLAGNRYMSISEPGGVLRMDESCFRIISSCGIIHIEGERMSASSMDNERILINGMVKSITFE